MSNSQHQDPVKSEVGSDVLKAIEEKFEKMTHDTGVMLTVDECDALKSVLRATSNKRADAVNKTAYQGTKNYEAVMASVEPGFCYLKLILCLPSLHEANTDLLSELILGLKQVLGKNPLGKNVLVHLTMSESVLSGIYGVSSITSEDPSMLMNSHQHLNTLKEMMKSKCCFTYEEAGGLFHIDDVSASCSCNEILCEHGWATRFILQVITRDSCIVGADVDFSALFVESKGKQKNPMGDLRAMEAKSEGTVSFEQLNDMTDTCPKIPTRKELQGNLEKDMVSMLSVTLDDRTNLLEAALKELLNAKNDRIGCDGDSVCDDSVLPVDSSSQIGRYSKKFMGSGTVYNVGKGGTKLDKIREEFEQQDVPEVVQGFIRTESMSESERASVSQVYSINGLAAPFRNSRLNFLAHFHTALDESKIDSKSDPMEAMECIGELKPRNPTEELMKQVVLRTFDFDRMVIVANPFKLPFVEIGMLLSDSALAKCFEFLKSEYRTLWFNEVKCLHVPQFHREFRQLSTGLSKARVHGQSGRLSQVVKAMEAINVSDDRQPSTNIRRSRKSSGSQDSKSLLGFRI